MQRNSQTESQTAPDVRETALTGYVVQCKGLAHVYLHVWVTVHVVNQFLVVGKLVCNLLLPVPPAAAVEDTATMATHLPSPEVITERDEEGVGAIQLSLLPVLVGQQLSSLTYVTICDCFSRLLPWTLHL